MQQKAQAATRGENIVDAEAARVAGSQSFALRHAQEQEALLAAGARTCMQLLWV
jgi:hypothetical protein